MRAGASGWLTSRKLVKFSEGMDTSSFRPGKILSLSGFYSKRKHAGGCFFLCQYVPIEPAGMHNNIIAKLCIIWLSRSMGLATMANKLRGHSQTGFCHA